MRIDTHVHLLPDDYRAALGDAPIPPTRLVDLQAMMDRHEIDRAVLSPGPPGAAVPDPAVAQRLARMANEGLAALAHERPDTFAALVTVPLADVDDALDELAYGLDELDMDGVMLLTNDSGTYLGDPRLDPLMSELDRRGAYVFVHPAFPLYPLPLGHPVWLYEFPFETVRATANLIYSGTFERYRRIRVQLPHLGGAVPFLADRLASLVAREPDQAQAAPDGVRAYLSRLFYDTGLTDSAPALAATLETVDPSQVVFGTDWPYAALDQTTVDPSPGLTAALDPAARKQLDIGGQRLVDRWASV